MHPVFLYLVLLGGNNEKFSGFLVKSVAGKHNTMSSLHRPEISQELNKLGQVETLKLQTLCV